MEKKICSLCGKPIEKEAKTATYKDQKCHESCVEERAKFDDLTY